MDATVGAPAQTVPTLCSEALSACSSVSWTCGRRAATASVVGLPAVTQAEGNSHGGEAAATQRTRGTGSAGPPASPLEGERRSRFGGGPSAKRVEHAWALERSTPSALATTSSSRSRAPSRSPIRRNSSASSSCAPALRRRRRRRCLRRFLHPESRRNRGDVGLRQRVALRLGSPRRADVTEVEVQTHARRVALLRLVPAGSVRSSSTVASRSMRPLARAARRRIRHRRVLQRRRRAGCEVELEIQCGGVVDLGVDDRIARGLVLRLEDRQRLGAVRGIVVAPSASTGWPCTPSTGSGSPPAGTRRCRGRWIDPVPHLAPVLACPRVRLCTCAASNSKPLMSRRLA